MTHRPHLSIDEAALLTVEHHALYEAANTVLHVWLDMQTIHMLRAEPFLIYLTVAVASTQRSARKPPPTVPDPTHSPLGPEIRSHISRRRLAEVTGIPLETVRRHVLALIASGHVTELGRGRLTATPGVVRRLAEKNMHTHSVHQFVASINRMSRLGFVRLSNPPAVDTKP